jgi:hypothetical protein
VSIVTLLVGALTLVLGDFGAPPALFVVLWAWLAIGCRPPGVLERRCSGPDAAVHRVRVPAIAVVLIVLQTSSFRRRV